MGQLDEIIEASKTKPQLLYKHSTRCGTCTVVRNQLDRQWSHDGKIDAWHLDLLKHRDISNTIADRFGVEHQSPQIIAIVNGAAIQHVSHGALSTEDLDALV